MDRDLMLAFLDVMARLTGAIDRAATALEQTQLHQERLAVATEKLEPKPTEPA
jgi:hypothetical protein